VRVTLYVLIFHLLVLRAGQVEEGAREAGQRLQVNRVLF
jgi:hypothetical protein